MEINSAFIGFKEVHLLIVGGIDDSDFISAYNTLEKIHNEVRTNGLFTLSIITVGNDALLKVTEKFCLEKKIIFNNLTINQTWNANELIFHTTHAIFINEYIYKIAEHYKVVAGLNCVEIINLII